MFEDQVRRNARNLFDALKTQDIKVPIGDTKVSIKTSHTGWKASINLHGLSELIVREYLSQIVPASALTTFLQNFVTIDFKSKVGLKGNYIRPKREGLSGLGLSILDSAAPNLNDAFSGTVPLPVGRMVEALTEPGLERRKPTDPLRTYVFKIAGELAVTPKTERVPFRGHLKVGCEVAYAEYADRIEISLGEITVVGGLQYYVDVERKATYTQLHDPFGLANQMPCGETMLDGPLPFASEKVTSMVPIKGTSKIKTLTLKESFTPAKLIIKSDGTIVQSDFLGRQYFMVFWVFVLFFLHTEMMTLTL